MYKTIPETVAYIEALAPLVAQSDETIYLAVPYTAIHEASKAAEGTNITIGAQNMNDATEGAFTGEIAGSMLVDAGAQFVILGHSERRTIFNESSPYICKKVKRAFEVGLQPILCIGETHHQRLEGKTKDVLFEQLNQSLDGVSQTDQLIIAYEPVWAIGTGESATPEMAQEVHALLRAELDVPLLYGGSVKPANVAELLAQPDIDGVLVGGASLDPQSFSQIVKGSNR